MSRRSEVAHKSNKTDLNLSLLEHALKDPGSQNLILQLLSANKKNVFEIFNTGAAALNSPVKRVKKVDHCESPTALLRRRELEKRNRAESVSSKISEQSIQSLTPRGSRKVAFEVILKGVVAYAEINSSGYDRSGGVKALLRSMGATVSEKFTRDVTHVIFKDGLYTTFQRAKLLKVHLVSVLWLEASRQNGIKAQEKNFPALGSKNYDLNISMICSQMQKEYEEVLKDEIKKSLVSGTSIPSAKTMMEDRRRTIGYSSNSFETSSQFGHGFSNNSVKAGLSRTGRPPSFQKPQTSSLTLRCPSPTMSVDEDLSIISTKILNDILNTSSSESFRPKSLQLGKDSENDTASECGMIDGDFSQKETVLDDTLSGIDPLQSDEVFTSNMEITCNENNCPEPNRTSTSTKDMDLTTPSGVLQTIKGSLLNSFSYLTSRGQCSTVEKNVIGGKENHHVSTPRDTPARKKQKDVDTTSTISKKKNVSQGLPDSPSAILENENFDYNDDFYSLKTPKFKASKKNLSKTTNLMIQDEIGPSKQKECSTKNSDVNCSQELSAENTMKFTPSAMSSLRMSKSSLESSGRPDASSSILHSENTKKITHSDLVNENVNKNVHDENVTLLLSSTPFATERKKRRTGTQIKIGPNDSISSESPSRNTRSSKNRNSIINKQKKGRCDDDSICGPEIGNNNILQESVNTPLSITPVVTGSNSKIKTRRNGKHEIITRSGALNSSDSPIRSTKKIIKDCSTLNKEKQDSAKELKISYEEENEIETTSRKSELRTPRPARKYASITPKKSDVFISPFVNTRPRRKSAARALEKMIEYNSETSVENTTGSTSQISLIKRGQPTRTPKKVEKQALSGITLEVDTQLTEEGPDAKELSKIMEDDENLGQYNSLNEPLKSVVLVQDIPVSPLHNRPTETLDKPPQKKSMVSLDSSSKNGTELTPLTRKKDEIESQSRKRLRTTRSSTVSFLSNAENEIQPSNERKTEKNIERKTIGVSSGSVSKKDAATNIRERRIEANEINEPNQVSRRKSEFNNQDTRMSRRIRRKLYDPEYCYTEQQIQEKLGVNDQEERETIRQKFFKVNAEPANSLKNGNVLMSQKALNFLEETRTDTKMLFKEPETVLNQLGIDREEKKEDSVMEDSADEQVDLAEEFVRRKKVKKTLDGIDTPQKTRRTQKTPRTQKTQRNLSQKALTTENRKRRSTMDFVPKTLNKPKMATMLDLDKKPATIVCTRLHKADVQIFSRIVGKLGKFEIEDEVSSRTTHLVVGETKRTINMLKAISRGCWILKHEWLLSSLEEGRWLPEEKYELTEFSSAVQQCRLRRQAFGPSYHMNIFLNCGMIFVAKSTVPRCSDLRELIILCGGKVTKIPDNAKISVGTYLEDIDSVSEYWILDSISSGKLEPIENYSVVPVSTHPKSPYV